MGTGGNQQREEGSAAVSFSKTVEATTLWVPSRHEPNEGMGGSVTAN